VILTLDLGTSVTKAAVWGVDGLVALAPVPLETVHPEPGLAEQDPAAWWSSVVDACGDLGRAVEGGLGAVAVVGLTGARQTFSLFDRDGRALLPGILWSDRRATEEAARLAAARGVEQSDASGSGGPLDAASVAAKVAWLSARRAAEVADAAWMLTPRDLVVWRLTGEAVTDATMASRAGLHDAGGRVDTDLAGELASRLPAVVDPGTVVGRVRPDVAGGLGVPEGTPVVVGAGDRACEVLGAGATETAPLLSWGTTANLSVPLRALDRPEPPPGVVASRAGDGGWMLEAGLSAAGSFLEWWCRLTGGSPAELATLAAQSPPGARGVVATPWLDGARAPWWRPSAAACLAGLSAAHTRADLARALFESVGWEVRRCLAALAGRTPAGPAPTELSLAGSGVDVAVWAEVVAGITGLATKRRRSGQAASAGAALLAAKGAGIGWDLDVLDPSDARTEPDPEAVRRYGALAERADRLADAVIEL
jgi:xylulokinase